MTEKDPPPDNPFAAFGSDRTIIKPRGAAGGRKSAAPSPALSPASAFEGARSGTAGLAPPTLSGQASLNPLVQAAAPLLSTAPKLRAMARHPDPQGLRASLAESIKRFEGTVQALHLPHEQIVAARYILCTMLDEAASGTPWGGGGAWSSQSLLVQFHNESWGGEKIFQLLSRLAENPAQHRNLLELIYVTLSLGFEGRFKVLDNGKSQLDSVRERLAQILRNLAGPAEHDLSVQWAGLPVKSQRLRDGLPLWVVAVTAAALLAVVFLILRMTLNAQTDTAFGALQSVDTRSAAVNPVPVPVAAPATPVAPRLAQLLKADIDASRLKVEDLADRSVVTLGDTMFEPGSSDLSVQTSMVIEHIASALNRIPGRVVIVGHTDSRPIKSLRFPSNWHLSRARALAVRSLLAKTVAPERLMAEGHADAEPVADNSNEEGRARNRRVEITLFVSAPN